MGNLIYALKGGGLEKANARLAELLSWRLSQENPDLHRKQLVFVPSPPQKRGEKDHAYSLARELSRIWGQPLWPGLMRVSSSGPQKKASRVHRQRTKIASGLESGQSELYRLNPDQIIFVDDVLTTGSTALAAQKVLPPEIPFSAWVLAERSRLRV
ncbi:MAG: hypothetical protein KDD59_02485 [Bdellovibrionales bacterium]|nr:hypothetical protein [Bdellovibrionales bacterium]